MQLDDVVNEFILMVGWNDCFMQRSADLKISEASSWYLINTDVGEVDIKVCVYIFEEEDIVRLDMFIPDLQVPDDVGIQLEVLTYLNLVNQQIKLGALSVISNRLLKFSSSIDVTKTSFNPQHLKNLLVDGTHELKNRIPEFHRLISGEKLSEVDLTFSILTLESE